MPDKWEFPWFASWDLGFHCAALAHVDPQYREGSDPADAARMVHAPERANSGLRVGFWRCEPAGVVAGGAGRVRYRADRTPAWRTTRFLERVFNKMLLNFTWWVNRKDPHGNNIFQGGFLGMDNIGAFDRGKLPPGYMLGQADGTSWMAAFARSMLVDCAAAGRSRSRCTRTWQASSGSTSSTSPIR